MEARRELRRIVAAGGLLGALFTVRQHHDEAVMMAVVTAIALAAELVLGGQLRDDLLGRAVRAWIGIGVSTAMVAQSNLLEVVVAASGVVLVVLTLLRMTPEQVGRVEPRMDRRSARKELERAAESIRRRPLPRDTSQEGDRPRARPS